MGHALAGWAAGDDGSRRCALWRDRGRRLGVEGGRIAWVGAATDLPRRPKRARGHDWRRRWVTPGLIDCHTHLVIRRRPRGRIRAAPERRELRGDRARRRRHPLDGRGDARRQPRTSSPARRRPRSRRCGRGRHHGRDQVGLRPRRETEARCCASRARSARARRRRRARPSSARMRCRRSSRTARRLHRPRLRPMPAASPPTGWPTRSTRSASASRFTPEQTRRVFEPRSAAGLPVKLHAEQLSDQGGAALGGALSARSRPNISNTPSEAGIAAMAAAGTVAVLLPGAFYFLRETQAAADGGVCARTACRSRWPPTATPAPRRRCRCC